MTYNLPFQWIRQPEAEALLLGLQQHCLQKNRFIAHLSDELEKHSNTRLFDWIDHFSVPHDTKLETTLETAGFITESATSAYRVFCHPGAQLPRILMHDRDSGIIGIAFKVDYIADFLMVRGISGWIEGSPYTKYRRCCVSNEGDICVWAIERRSYETMEPFYASRDHAEKYLEAKEKWMTRPRALADEERALAEALLMADELVAMIGQELAACMVLECERAYWQSRNTAGQIQKNRQDRLGMGWANHDHHTFRSSRKHFSQLVRLFELLGFHCRERFYAGKEAGWGAQVMENSKCGLVLFLDLDLDPGELDIDFPHHPLPELKQLGTIGLWCALHGESILKAGMHHLEAQFLFDALSRDLSHHGVGMMDPFSQFPYLKQAFTHGEVWPVNPQRIEHLLNTNRITKEEAEKFLKYGAVGSHMENLQRREGYKGFNQKNVSSIIQKTDPRHMNT